MRSEKKKLVIVKQPEYRQENILLRSFTPVNAAISDPAACAGNGNHVQGSGSEDEETQSRRNTDHMMSEPSREEPDCCMFLVFPAFMLEKDS